MVRFDSCFLEGKENCKSASNIMHLFGKNGLGLFAAAKLGSLII